MSLVTNLTTLIDSYNVFHNLQVNIPTVNCFTQVTKALIVYCKIINLTIVGTSCANKICIPVVFKANREINSTICGFQNDILQSYPTYQSHESAVYMMSLLHHDKGIDLKIRTRQKPAIITFYNRTKSFVDVDNYQELLMFQVILNVGVDTILCFTPIMLK